MIQIKKFKLKGKSLAAAVTAAILALLIIAYAVISAILPNLPKDNTTPELPELMDGEAYYGNSTVAYPTVSQSEIQSISVFSEKGDFYMKRPKAGENFIFYYTDEYGEDKMYYPPIASAEDGFDYSDLYAIEAETGLNMQKITYLCTTLGVLYFTERIPLATGDNNAQLTRYGLNEEARESIHFTYLDKEGKEQDMHLYIGDGLVIGTGYYFMVRGRDYIYSSISNGFDYALSGFESLLGSRLIAEGLAADKTYEPYLTTDYKQWKNTVVDRVGAIIAKNSEVVVKGNMLTPVDLGPDHKPNSGQIDGYEYDGLTERSVDLEYLASRPEFERLIKALEGKAVGDYSSDPFVASVIMNTNDVEMTDGVSGKYTYIITAIESVLTDTEEIDEVGASVGDAGLVKVTYNYYIDGKSQNNIPCHAVIDLDDGNLPAEARAALSAAKVGKLDEFISYEITYKEDSATRREVKYVISDIVLIYNSKFEYSEVISSDSIVNYTYYYMIDGVQVGPESSSTVNLAEIKEGVNLEIKNKLLGRGTGSDLSLVGYTDVMYCETMQNFIAYTFNSIDYFVERELVTAFAFVNSSERDPFYGESLYANKLTNKYKTYALNAQSCETVVRILGGINEDGSSQLSAGLSGSETVAVGLNPFNMKKYGLYAHTIYFELPRGIVSYAPEGSEYDDFDHLDTLGFHLYISDEQPDGTRFVGSDMYDIIVKIDGSTFDFVEHSFVDFWARRSLVMVDYQDIDRVGLEFNMSGVTGKYDFRFEHQLVYIGNDGGQYEEEPEGGGNLYDRVDIHASILGDATETELSKILAAEGFDSLTLANLYNRILSGATGGQGFTIGNDYAGTAYFKELLLIMYATYYTGTLTEAEQKAALESVPKLMSVSFKVTDSSPYDYVYDFYRASDRKIMVVIYERATDGTVLNQVSDFYISTFAFKKIAGNFIRLLDGKEIDSDVGYVEY